LGSGGALIIHWQNRHIPRDDYMDEIGISAP
jgi:hypothetical protein